MFLSALLVFNICIDDGLVGGFVMMQAAKEFESELKTEPEPEDSVAGSSSPVAMSNKEEEKTEVSSSSKDNNV